MLGEASSTLICDRWDPGYFISWGDSAEKLLVLKGPSPMSPQVQWACHSPSLVAYHQIWGDTAWCQHDADISGHNGPSLAPELPFQVSGHGWHLRVSLLQRSCLPPKCLFLHPLQMLTMWVIHPYITFWTRLGDWKYFDHGWSFEIFMEPIHSQLFLNAYYNPIFEKLKTAFLGASMSCLH